LKANPGVYPTLCWGPTGWPASSLTNDKSGSSAPFLPLLTRDLREAGLICQHCNETLVPFEEIPDPVRAQLDAWAVRYSPVHAVAHWDDAQRKGSGDYNRAFERAAEEAEELLRQAGGQLVLQLLEFYPAIVWEDQDECLEVRPEDVTLTDN
jgi:hypothetical protein